MNGRFSAEHPATASPAKTSTPTFHASVSRPPPHAISQMNSTLSKIGRQRHFGGQALVTFASTDHDAWLPQSIEIDVWPTAPGMNVKLVEVVPICRPTCRSTPAGDTCRVAPRAASLIDQLHHEFP